MFEFELQECITQGSTASARFGDFEVEFFEITEDGGGGYVVYQYDRNAFWQVDNV